MVLLICMIFCIKIAERILKKKPVFQIYQRFLDSVFVHPIEQGYCVHDSEIRLAE